MRRHRGSRGVVTQRLHRAGEFENLGVTGGLLMLMRLFVLVLVKLGVVMVHGSGAVQAVW